MMSAPRSLIVVSKLQLKTDIKLNFSNFKALIDITSFWVVINCVKSSD